MTDYAWSWQIKRKIEMKAKLAGVRFFVNSQMKNNIPFRKIRAKKETRKKRRENAPRRKKTRKASKEKISKTFIMEKNMVLGRPWSILWWRERPLAKNDF